MFPYGWAIIQRRHNKERQRAARRIAHRHIRDHSNPFDVPAEVFTKLYRLSKRTAHFLVECLHQNLNRQRQHGIPVHIKVLASLHFFGHGGYQTTVGQGQYLGLSQPSVSKCLQEVADAIITVLLNGMVLFPETEEERAENKQRFLQIAGFPSVLGLIDCSQISIVRPKDTALVPARLFFNRKGFYSLNCQFVCNAKMEIIHFNATFPGSTHDAAVWQGSSLSQLLETNYVNGVSAGEWLLGDSGYAQLPWLMTPYADADENTPEARYNLAHTKTRVLIEKCFGVMKTRFRCIHKHRTLHYDPVKASKIIAAVVVLHNVAIKRNEPLPDELQLEDRLRPADDPPRDMNFLNVARNIRNNITRQYFA
ncbi:unnamed protein product [Parnassius apollo]|uniref:(apollo) hypothetical protein n=1 Tax=Parnassius apollo TaxID=110799 RepID=A0A8S3W555_PARAO|nr:unnamed protein product [Parnassius apollo]